MEIPRPVPSEVENKEPIYTRYKSVLIGSAIGDTLGMPVEGWHRDQIRRYVGSIQKPIDPVLVRNLSGIIVHEDETGSIPYISPYLQKGQITDDTWLAIATARSIVESSGLNLENLAKHSVSIYKQQIIRYQTIQHQSLSLGTNIPPPFGETTIKALENLQRGITPTESGVMSPIPGNAPVLKMAPVGIYMHVTKLYDEGLQFAQEAGRMTHLDPRSIVSGLIQAHAVYSLLSGVTRQEFLTSIINICKEWERSAEQNKKVTMLKRLQWVDKNRDIDDEYAYQQLGIGWAVTKNYPFALFMFQKNWDTPLEGLLKTVNYGGDCDSTAAMYGTLAGAKNGIFYPNSWPSILESITELTDLATKIAAIKT